LRALDDAARRHCIKWRWVKGQNGDPGNERADVLATSARLNTDSESRAYIGDVSAVDLALARRQNVASERRITSRRMRDKRRVKRAHPRRLRALVLVADGLPRLHFAHQEPIPADPA
jgi:hypothetical protein